MMFTILGLLLIITGNQNLRIMDRKKFLKTSGLGLVSIPVMSSMLGSCVDSEKSSIQNKSLSVKNRNPVDEFLNYDMLGLAALIKTNQLSKNELLEVIINRIEKVNPEINCIATQSFTRARDKISSFGKESLFAGVPILIKDMIDISGIRRTDGSILMAANIPQKSVPYINAIENAGLNIVGTTTVPEFANGISSKLFGLYKNPWDLDRCCMMSSSGAGATVSAGILPMVHGTDGGGSNRLPSSACGTFGYKPTRGRMYSGEDYGGHDIFKTNGPISRTVRDAAALFSVCEDANGEYTPIGMVTKASKKRLKIAFMPGGVQGFPVEQSIQNVQYKVAVKLREMGHQVDEMKHPLDGLDFYDNFRHAFIPKYTPLLEAVTNITGKTPLKSGLIEPWTASMIELSRNYSQAQIESGNQYFKNELKSIYEPIFDKYDIILTPTMPVETPLANFITTDEDFAKRGIDLEMLLSLTSPVNPMGDCAMSVPLKFSEKTKLPVGSMFHAKSGNDKMLFELAYELEEAFPWNNKWAPHSLMFT